MPRFVITFLFALNGVFAQSAVYDFESDYQGWACDFADYNVADSANWHLWHKHDTLPQIKPRQYGLIFHGDNYSDDLFFFLKRKFTGLVPNARYSLTYSIDLATDMPPDGIGGIDLTLKAGATAVEPVKVAAGGMYRMNIDKNNQTRPGADMDTLGHVNHSFPSDFTYHLVTFSNSSHPFRIQADASGGTWLIIGAESAFETPGYFQVGEARISFSPAASLGDARRKGASPGREIADVLGRRFAPDRIRRAVLAVVFGK